MKKTASEAADKLTKNIDELKIKDKLKEAGGKISDNASMVGSFIKDKTQKALNSEFVQGITKTAESGINVVIEKTKILLNKKDDVPENVNVIMLNNEQKNNNENIQNINQNQDIQMSNVVNNNINNINENNNNINDKNEIENLDEAKNEEIKKEEIKNEEKIEEKKEENNNDSGNINNNIIENKKIEEENVKFEPENPNGP